MTAAIMASRTQTNVPLSVLVTRDGGITGLTVVARIFNGNDLSQFLDFSDGVFKDAGHATPTITLPATQATAAPGVYAIDGGFNLSAITVPASAASLLVRYTITAGGESGDDVDIIKFIDEVDAILADTAAMQPTIATNLDALVSTRATQAQILSDATPFSGANVDAAISTRESEASAATREATNTAEHTTTQGDIAALNDLSQADVQSAMTAQGYTAARGVLLDALAEITSLRMAELDAANLPADVDAIRAKTDLELVRLHTYLGLLVGTPSVHTPTSIAAGGIAQTVVTVGTTVTKTATS